VLRRIFESNKEEVAGGWRRMHNVELHNLYTSLNIIWAIKSRSMRWTGHVACMGEMGNEYNILVGKPEWERPHGRPRHRWEDNSRMDLRERGMDWSHLAQDRGQWCILVNTVMGVQIP
jgi:hypothetical protein